MVQPSVPWPVFRNRFLCGVRPTMGVLSGVMGRRPVQNSARARSPPGNSWLVTISSVARRCGRRFLSKPESSAMPPTRMRLSKRVRAIL